jgi:hypothetical protein
VNRDDLYAQLVAVAKRKTAEADTQLDEKGRPIEPAEDDFGGSVLIVELDAELTKEDLKSRTPTSSTETESD